MIIRLKTGTTINAVMAFQPKVTAKLKLNDEKTNPSAQCSNKIVIPTAVIVATIVATKYPKIR